MPSVRSKARKPPTAVDASSNVTASSGNVFQDLNVPNPELALAKAKLVSRVRQLIADRSLTQTQAASLLGVDQPKVSALVRGQVTGYTLDRLIRFLNTLGQQVEISVRPCPAGKLQKRISVID